MTEIRMFKTTAPFATAGASWISEGFVSVIGILNIGFCFGFGASDLKISPSRKP
ncbi:hypothetical protein [Wenzhouxiangella sp. EGI_FJ10409]|uniref:hypothetical protein n=1 Tax=Wenzhouxiangella sp. EGI_FJ10409 TaxID=3243767 RepID=UPI0035D83926